MRTIKELLILLKSDIEIHGIHLGMCSRIHYLCPSKITIHERDLLLSYLKRHAPKKKNRYNDDYWFEIERAKPRIAWIDKQLKKL